MRWVANIIRWWMGGYKERLPELPTLKVDKPVGNRIAIVGGGWAGMVAATVLAERGCQVTLYEAKPHLGGRAGCAKVELHGEEWYLDHGFHAFFYQYYNLWRFMERLHIVPNLAPIGDYLIIDKEGQEYRFAGIHTTPVLNILSLVRRGLPPLRDVMFNHRLSQLRWMLRYRKKVIYDKFDSLTFADFCAKLQLPAKLKLVLTTLGRSFFTQVEKLSTADLLKSFHFYFLSHDQGLLYDYIDGDYQEKLIDPVLKYWQSLPIDLRFEQPVKKIVRDQKTGLINIEEDEFDELILAADGPAVEKILAASPEVAPQVGDALQKIPQATGCGVYRLWFDKKVERDVPVYFSVERIQVTDAVSFPDRITRQAKEWSARTNGGVIELHSYSLPENLTDEQYKQQMLTDLLHYLPELRDAKVLMEHFERNRSVSALHTGYKDMRPTVQTDTDNVYVAGDWVQLPTPALLMEAACTAGLLASNMILAKRGLAQEPLDSVPRRGILTWRPGRHHRPLD